MLTQKLYNAFTWVWHKCFRIPVRLKATYDRKVKKPELTVVFLHGISATSDTWRTTLKQLARDPDLEKVRLVALDLLGFGKSLRADWLDYDYLDYDQALDQALKHLRVKTPVVLVGHSMGSLIAADYATNFHPSVELAELVLVSPPVLMAEELARLPDKAYTKTYGSLHKIATEVPAADVLAHLVQRFSSFRSTYIRTAAFAKSMEQVILNRKNYQTYTKIRIPTTIIHGHFDPLVMRSNLKRAAKQNSRYITYVSVIGQHDISVGKRAKILAEIKKVLKNASKQTETV
jgi:pimeloyl-ACP methyl ester carboxylesterase